MTLDGVLGDAEPLSDSVYDVTSPDTLPHHVIIRKLYSLICFAVLGLLFGRSFGPTDLTRSIARAGFAIGLYSLLVEVGQRFAGSHEGLKWNAVDIALGAMGGAMGGALDWLWTSFRAPTKDL